ncbi:MULTISPECIES: sensor histidine kinase [Microbacterium]|uniref:sensor histidine kinase n=1 Tax=Microbacterium TaxID=33882 RepID=UPI000D6486A7|nr:MULTISPECIES: sensor histidine kinase [Microbacterium]
MGRQAANLVVVEQQLERVMTVVPYVLLVLSMALSLVAGSSSWHDQLVTLGIALVAGLWIWLMSSVRPPGPLFVWGLIGLIAVLAFRDPWFAGFFGFVGYLQSWHVLRGAWRIVGVAVTALVTMTPLLGGVIALTPLGALVYALVLVALVMLVALFSLFGDVTAERADERTRIIAQLEETLHENEQLQQLLIDQAREGGARDERERIAMDIHDTLAQGFTGIITQLQAAERSADRHDDADMRHHLGLAMSLARGGLDEARRSVRAIGPRMLDAAHLPEAITTLAAEWSERSGVRAVVQTTGNAQPLHPEVETTLLRVAQEALANAAKHAHATRAGVTLSYMGDLVSIDIRDDGRGFDPAAHETRGGFGLISMRERAARVDGSLAIESAPGSGTAVSATLPALSRDGA